MRVQVHTSLDDVTRAGREGLFSDVMDKLQADNITRALNATGGFTCFGLIWGAMGQAVEDREHIATIHFGLVMNCNGVAAAYTETTGTGGLCLMSKAEDAVDTVIDTISGLGVVTHSGGMTTQATGSWVGILAESAEQREPHGCGNWQVDIRVQIHTSMDDTTRAARAAMFAAIMDKLQADNIETTLTAAAYNFNCIGFIWGGLAQDVQDREHVYTINFSLVCNANGTPEPNEWNFLMDVGNGCTWLMQSPNLNWWDCTCDSEGNLWNDPTTYSGATIDVDQEIGTGKTIAFGFAGVHYRLDIDSTTGAIMTVEAGTATGLTTYTTARAFSTGVGIIITDSLGVRRRITIDNDGRKTTEEL
jgi:hypothetical protein